MHHQKGADSLRLRLLLMEIVMFCLQYSGSVLASVTPSAVTYGDGIDMLCN